MNAKYPVLTFSVLLFAAGLYLEFLYDVPDSQQATNSIVSIFLILLGICGIIFGALLKSRVELE
jgi:hypothetical protein